MLEDTTGLLFLREGVCFGQVYPKTFSTQQPLSRKDKSFFVAKLEDAMSDLNWNLRDILHEFKDSRLPVFVSIFLHKNTRNRSWPSNELIATETGLSSAPISAAIGWMLEKHVAVLVPFEKRVGLELRLPNRKNIYQLTGVVLVDDVYHPYMNLTPEGWQSIAADLEDMGNSLLSKQLNDVDSLLSKCLDSKRKGIKGIALDSEGTKEEKSRKRSTSRATESIHPLILAWATVRKIDTVNIGAPIYTTKDIACAKRMAKWEQPPTDKEIEAAVKASKSTSYRFQWLEADIGAARLANAPKPVEVKRDKDGLTTLERVRLQHLEVTGEQC